MGTTAASSRPKKRPRSLNNTPERLRNYVKLFWARKQAHACLDQLWRGPDAPYTRREAYEILCDVMGLAKEQAHIGMFTWQQCEAMVLRFIVLGLA